MNEMIYTYDGSFEGFLCCILTATPTKKSSPPLPTMRTLRLFCFPSGQSAPTAATPDGFCENCTSSPPTERS